MGRFYVGGLGQLAQRLSFDLARPAHTDAELCGGGLQRGGHGPTEAKTQPEDVALQRWQIIDR